MLKFSNHIKNKHSFVKFLLLCLICIFFVMFSLFSISKIMYVDASNVVSDDSNLVDAYFKETSTQTKDLCLETNLMDLVKDQSRTPKSVFNVFNNVYDNYKVRAVISIAFTRNDIYVENTDITDCESLTIKNIICQGEVSLDFCRVDFVKLTDMDISELMSLSFEQECQVLSSVKKNNLTECKMQDVRFVEGVENNIMEIDFEPQSMGMYVLYTVYNESIDYKLIFFIVGILICLGILTIIIINISRCYRKKVYNTLKQNKLKETKIAENFVNNKKFDNKDIDVGKKTQKIVLSHKLKKPVLPRKNKGEENESNINNGKS